MSSKDLLTRLDRQDSAALHGLLSGALWFVVGTTLGLTMSHELNLPDLFAGIPQLVFSRLRPGHVNIMLFGFLSTTFFGAWYYLVPRLCQTTLKSDRTANILLFLWNITVLIGTLALLNGDTKGKEYTEYPWYIDWPIEILMIVNIGIIYRTIATRTEPKMYVSLWYIGGTVVWIALMHFIGNVMWHPFTTTLPDGQIQAEGSLIGLNDAMWNWFYGHNVFGLYITTGGIGIVYYLVPKMIKRPIYSHTMSLVGFWAIVLLYSPTGQHHLLQAPIPNWLKIYAIIGSVGLIIPVFSQSANIFMTVRGRWGDVLEHAPLRFVMTGSLFYLAVSIQGSIQSLMVVNRFVHFTQWTVAHAHLALLGGFGFLSSGAMLYLVPLIVRRPLWSRNLADFQYWLMLIGLTGFFWSLTAAGLAQGSAWVNAGEQVVKTLAIPKPYFYLRSWFGAMIWVASLIQIFNLWMTMRMPRREPVYEPVHEEAQKSLEAAA